MEIEGEDPYEALNRLAQTDIKKKWDEEVTVWFSCPGACEVAPTARQFFAFSGVLSVDVFVTAKRTRSSCWGTA